MPVPHPSQDRLEQIRREHEAAEKLRREQAPPPEPPQTFRTVLFWIGLVVFSVFFYWLFRRP